MNGLRFTLKVFMIILISVGIVAGVIGAIIANYALIIAGAVLMTAPLILKLINDMIIEEFIPAIFEFLGIAAITFLYIWSLILASSAVANALDRPVLWVVGGVGIIQLLLFLFAFRAE